MNASSRPAFAIYETFPIYCQITSAVIGSGRSLVRYCDRADFARKMANVLRDRDYADGGENIFDAYRIGSDRPIWMEENNTTRLPDCFDDMPF
jgi:hypothetical protein